MLLAYGPNDRRIGVPQIFYGNGWVCAGGPLQRVSTTQWASPSGTVTYPVDLTTPPYNSGLNQIFPGSTWNFQFWYRDPGGGLSAFNFSSAVQIVFAP